MKKVGIAGLQREIVKAQIEASAPGMFECYILNDMDAAMKVKSGQFDYFIGCCNTGAGAALSMAIALLGFGQCCTIAKPSIRAKEEEIEQFVREGRVAFGLSVEHVEHAIPMLVREIERQCIKA